MSRDTQIGADVYNTTETELDKNNLSTRKSETENRVAFPELGPGRALIDIETGDLHEFMHRQVGMVDTVEGRQSESEEYMNWKYRTPEGQDWGGIIQHRYLSYTTRDCPAPNDHDEIQMPLTHPTEADLTTVAPHVFSESVLFDEERPRPLLLVERPEVTYEEAMPGDSFTVVGWFDPAEQDPEDRTKPTVDITSQHPEIVGGDAEVTVSRGFNNFGASLTRDTVTDSESILISQPTDSDTSGLEMQTQSDLTNFHIDVGQSPKSGGLQFLIDSPFEAKDDIKELDRRASWDSDASQWTIDGSRDALDEMLASFTAAGWEFSISPQIIEVYGDTSRTVTPVEDDLTATTADVFDYTFGDTARTLPGVEGAVQLAEISEEYVRIEQSENTTSVSGVEQPAENHLSEIDSESNTVRFDCPHTTAPLVKSLDWGSAQYDWIAEDSQWKLNQTAATALVQTVVEGNEPLTMTLTGATQMTTETLVRQPTEQDTETLTTPDPNRVPLFSQHSALADEPSVTTTETVGISPQSPDRLALAWVDMKIAGERKTTGLTVDLGDDPIPELSPSVAEQWRVSDTNDGYNWYRPTDGARIRVTPIEGYGTEYELHVKQNSHTNSERVVTLADEQKLALTVITHMKSL